MVAIDRKSAAGGTPARRKGVLAVARVTEVTAAGAGGRRLVRLGLRVTGPGIAFDSAARVAVDGARRANVDAGRLVVLVDPTSLDFQIDWDRSAFVNGVVPARFALADGEATVDLSGQAGPLLEILRILWSHNVSLGRLTDADADPAVREQVRAVIRRAAGQ
jgi:hypothetical protein